MKIKSQRDFASGIMFLAVGLAFAIGATTYSFGTSARPGPGYFPLLLGIILCILGAIVLTIFSWAIFIVGLKLTIPMWPWFVG